MRVARIEVPQLPPPVLQVAAQLAAAGGRCWLVGGTVRDLLRGESPRDFDIATDLVPADVLRAVPEADGRDARLGACQLTATVPSMSITTLRRERGYTDHRHPDQVEFVRDLAIDALRRDFTVNAIYLDLASGELCDPCGGQRHLAEGVLATIGPAAERLREDPLRLLRAVRFAARCQLEPTPELRAAAIAQAELLQTLSKERIFAELDDAFTSPGRGRALRLLVEFGLAAVVLPEVAAMDGVTQPPEYHPEGDVLTHVCLVLDQVPAGQSALSWSAVLHDVGKPPTWRQAEDRIRFDGHDTLSADMADAVLRRLHASNELREAVVDVCLQHIRFAALPGMRPRKAERWLRSPAFPLHLAFHRADCMGSHGDLTIHAFATAALAALPPERPPLVVAADVMALGVPPGPAIGRLLRAVQAAADESTVSMDRQQALVLLRDMVERGDQGPLGAAR